MTSLLMTSSGSTDVALGNILKEQVFESRRSPFSELRRLSCGAHHATSFQQVQIQTDGIRPGLGMRLAVLHPDSLHPDSLHGDSLHGDQVCDLGLRYVTNHTLALDSTRHNVTFCLLHSLQRSHVRSLRATPPCRPFRATFPWCKSHAHS